ncbi:MAG: carboxypeptidase-like regulatory domain-containing protein [Flavobacteriales bacterium]|nr:carboxypeptidase-like regulatory domain-containing protein [Flavobacteriales bacterium]
MLRKLLSTVIIAIASISLALAQNGQGSLKGKVLDKETGEPLPFVNVVVESNGTQVAGGSTDFDGKFNIKPIPPGSYTVKARFAGYQPLQINGLIINADKITFKNLSLTGTAIEMEEFEIIEYTVPLISKDNTASGGTITREDIMRMPGRSATSVAATVGGVYSKDDGSGDLNVRGGRSDANYYYIDGIKVRGGSNLPKSAIEQITVITGGVPAQYGDVTGGIISITTRGASKEFFGGIEYITSGYKLGGNMVGLDAYGYNLLEYSVSGPILFKRDTAGNKTEPLAGFFLAGNFTDIVDENPSGIGVWYVKDEKLAAINANPLRYATNGAGTFQEAEFLRLGDLENVKTKKNARKKGFVVQGKLDFNLGLNANLTFGGSMDYLYRHDFALGSFNTDNSYALLNSENNRVINDIDWRVYGRFTQRFNNNTAEQEEESATTIKNAYYTIQYDYQENYRNRFDDSHKDNLFSYGYVGSFKTYQQAFYQRVDADPSQGFNSPFMNHLTYEDTLIAFDPSNTTNQLAANYTSNYYSLYGWQGFDAEGNPLYDYAAAQDPDALDDGEVNFYLRNVQNIQQNGGLLNGDSPDNIYGLWRSPAFQSPNFDKRKENQHRFTAQGSADIKDHAITVGFEYEQRTDRRYFINPRALWTLGRLYTNNHIRDLCNDMSDQDCIDSVQVFFDGSKSPYPFIKYGRLNASRGEYDRFDDDEAQYFFDYNLRESLGYDTDGTQWIDFDSYSPSELDVSFFAADEILQDRNSVALTYYGYDHAGNIQRGNPTVDDYFTARDDFGNLTRPIGAFRPIYIAGFIQDKFSFDDLVFNIGLRVDRYDGNQSVLADEFSLFPTARASQDLSQFGITADVYDPTLRPTTIGEDYVVYVDNLNNPNDVVGFRDPVTNTWFNAEGTEIEDASTLRTPTGIAPLLVDASKTEGKDISSGSFVDYTPQNTFMPRVAFSFPISDEALFFAHYDVLAKRPTTGQRLDLIDYYYIESVGQNQINNPNLKPEKTIDYELGFQQKINNSSSLKLSAFYRELRDMVQVVNRQDAFPQTYITYDNVDFATIKGLTVAYDLRRSGNIWAKVSYTLQYADGTGSRANGSLNLIRAGKPNLKTLTALSYDQRHAITATIDYRYADGKDYNGPILMDKQILANTGANFVFVGGSGTPYNKQQQVTPRAPILPQAGSLEGTINGSRLPFTYRVDARIDRDVELSLGKDDDKRAVNVNVYLQFMNLLNNINVIGVHRFTGNPDDDGYLVAPQFQNDINSQNDPQSYKELYSIKVDNPANYTLPRRIRLGIMVNF